MIHFMPLFGLVLIHIMLHSDLFRRVPVERQKLRSGFPPRELHPPEDPTQPVALVNGEKVSVDILPAPAMPPSEEASYKTRGEVAGQIKQGAGQAEGEEAGLQQQAQQTQQGNGRFLWRWC